MIEALELSKMYGDCVALNRFSCRVQPATIVGLLGANGAGKSTVMKILTGLLAPSDGTAFIDGYDILTQGLQARRRIGYLPEHTPLYRDMKIDQYLQYMSVLKGMEGIFLPMQIRSVVEECFLGEVVNKKIGSLSRGFRQRVGLAQALLGNPPLLILDEPTAGLDPTQAQATRMLLQKWGKTKTILLSTHILSDVEQICDRVMILHQGRLVVDGEISHLLKREVLLLRAHAPRATLAEKLQSLPGIERMEWLSEIFRIHVQAGYDPTFSIGKLCNENGWPIVKMDYEKHSLSDVYLEATRTEKRV